MSWVSVGGRGGRKRNDQKPPELCVVKAELIKGNSIMIQSVYLSTTYVIVLQTTGFRGRLAVRRITKRGTCGRHSVRNGSSAHGRHIWGQTRGDKKTARRKGKSPRETDLLAQYNPTVGN